MAALNLELRDKHFPAVGGAPSKPVIGAVRLSVEPGERLAIIGPSGCGKTTLLNIIAGLDKSFAGSVRLAEGTRLAYVFQEPRLLPWLTVEDNLKLVLADDPYGDAKVAEWLGEMGLGDVRAVFPARLSLGMARRVALARAFIIQPTLLLMDEPFVSLDEPTAERLRRLLLEILRAHPATVLFVTHNLREAITLADRIALLAPAPTRVLREVEVPLARERRFDPAALEHCRAALASELPALALAG
jgi:ABC-type nitrate/sulfonate/bicarbonate transport system ATPase subunit